MVGYKIYYNNGSSSLPLNGNDAAEGVSPIDVGDQLNVTLTGLKDSEIYFFAVTAYNADGLESTFSNIVASDWMPELFSPAVNDTVSPTEVTFSWSQAPAGTDVAYTLYLGTDANLPVGTLAQQTSQAQTLFAGAALLGLLGTSLVGRRKQLAAMTLCLTFAVLVAGCGGGGGGSDSAPAVAPVDNPPANGTTVVSGLAQSSYTAEELQPGTQYFWKIVAIDAQGNERESAVGSFTTGQL
ncbi:MAG: hypothetical protein IH614_13395 [Desulfuromonadales bacterium]|nr:hypothetical protein [Desulfuromonadales bacterium]